MPPSIIPISDLSDPRLDVFARLTENQLLRRDEPSQALFIAESPLVIGRAMDGGCTPVSFLIETPHITGKARPLLERCGPEVPVFTAGREVLSGLTGFHLTRGILCAFRRPAVPDAEAVCRGRRRVAVLENVMNPTNMGAIFRCAAALGIDAVVLTHAGCDPLYRRCTRVSMGNVFLIPWAYLPQGRPWTQLLKDLGFQTVALALRRDALPLSDPRLALAERLAIVLGTEGDGLRAETVTACDYTACIPMHRGVDSLNVAAASAIAFHQLCQAASPGPEDAPPEGGPVFTKDIT